MHPEVRQPRSHARLGLRDLVGVMHGNVIFAAAMDVEVVAQILLRHRRALDVPTGEADAPRARPFHLALLAGRGEFPQREVGGAFLFADVDAFAGFETRAVESRQISVAGLLAGVEIDAIRGAIREPVLLDIGNEIDLLGDVIGGAAEHRRALDVERRGIVEKILRVDLGDLPRGLTGAARPGFHLVLAGVGVAGQVSHVGDVHHVRDTVAVPLEHAPEHVLEQERAETSDMLVLVHRRPAGIEPDLAGLERLEGAQASSKVVVERERSRHRRSVEFVAEGSQSRSQRQVARARGGGRGLQTR